MDNDTRPVMTELEAVRTLRDPLSGPGTRYEAEQVLLGLGWRSLALALAGLTGPGEAAPVPAPVPAPVRDGQVERITSAGQLAELAGRLQVRPDWHEPDAREVSARVFGDHLDNAGFWGHARGAHADCVHNELWVEISRDGEPVAEVCLADLLAWASRA